MNKIVGILLILVFISAKENTERKINSLKAPTGSVNFLVVGDWGRNGEYNQKEVASCMGKASQKIGADFIVSTGDNFYPNGVASIQDDRWQSSFEKIYTAHSLMVDWYVVLGNHDYRGNPEAEIQYSNISRRWKMPSRYYAYNLKVGKDSTNDILLAFLDTNPFQKEYYSELKYQSVAQQDTSAQKKWLDSILSVSKARWKIVIGHHPMYSSGKRVGQGQSMESAFKTVFEKYRVDAYFAGHEHDLQHQKPAGHTHYFVSGAGSEIRPVGKTENTRFSASEHGFMAISVTKDFIEVHVLNDKEKIIYSTRISK